MRSRNLLRPGDRGACRFERLVPRSCWSRDNAPIEAGADAGSRSCRAAVTRPGPHSSRIASLVGQRLAQPLTLVLLAALSLASCYFGRGLTMQWAYEANGLFSTIPALNGIARAAFLLVELTLPFILNVRGMRTRFGQDPHRTAPSMPLVIAMLAAISSAGVILRAIHAWSNLVSDT